MSRLSLPLAVAAAAVVFVLQAGSAHAQNNHSYVSATADPANITCTRTAPCNSFSKALDATNPRGVISVLDTGDYGQVTIDKSLTVRAEGSDGGATSATPSGSHWIIIQAGPSDVVTLEGLHLIGGGIRLDSGAHLHIVRCRVINTRHSGVGSSGIWFHPNAASRLSVTDSVFSNNGLGTGGGIVINPLPGGNAQVNLERVTVNGNAFGIAADGTGSTGGINMTIADSMVGGNAQDGIIAVTPSGGAPIGVMVKNSKSVNNAIGIRSIGPNVTVRVDGSSIIGNSTGLSFSGGGALLSYGNNNVDANGANGAFSGSVGLQ